ncbi:MAG TPA: NUDIX hydrolase [Puia sp.]|nr:NUDIX hydrolase [Puia sp.]
MDNQDNPWTILSSKEIYDNPWVQITEFQVINPNGGNGIYGKVHYKNIAVGVIAIDENWNTWLVGQYRFPLDIYSWEIPEGGGSMDEDPIEAAKRELLEETGLIAKEWIKILTMHLSNSVSDEFSMVYLARSLEQEKSSPEETEDLVVKKLPFDEVVEMVESGKITDAISIAAIQQIQIMILTNKLKR